VERHRVREYTRPIDASGLLFLVRQATNQIDDGYDAPIPDTVKVHGHRYGCDIAFACLYANLLDFWVSGHRRYGYGMMECA